MSKVLSSALILSKFRGCLLGGLLGDCCGAPYEGETLDNGDKLQLNKSLNQLEAKKVKVIKPYTDDTAMTMALSACLIKNKSIPYKELAKNYCYSYFTNPNRGFGGAVPRVLHALKREKYENPLEPAKLQFDGSGSYGNGAAMRVAPIGLFCLNQPIKNLIKLATDSAIITHTHHLAVNGAILHAIAVNYCLKTVPSEFNKNDFLNYLREQLKIIEHNEDDLENKMEYQKQLTKIEDLLKREPSNEMVINNLGNSVAALWSITTALYCFLRAQEPIEKIETENIFRRTIEYAIHLGGDTDTIACMAGQLSGALYGDEIISKNILSYCEANEEVSEMAENLYEISVNFTT